MHHVLPFACSFSYVSVPTTNTQHTQSHSVCACDFCCSQLFQLLLALSQRVVVEIKIAELKGTTTKIE